MAIEPRPVIGAIGAGRMGRGIALAFAYAGHAVTLIDLKPRNDQAFRDLSGSVNGELRRDLDFLAGIGTLRAEEIPEIIGLVRIAGAAEAAHATAGCDVIFECVPEIVDAKKGCFAFVGAHAHPECLVASTTSTIAADTLAGFVDRPERFCNAHWLNPAHLMPLVEVSPCGRTSPETEEAMRALLTGIGKIAIVCKSSPGYIVPRIQALAMNEAARLVEEGVASVEDIDTAIRVGFGLRFTVLGLLEFIDWGGGDTLYHASRFLAGSVDAERFAPPAIVEANMRKNRRGLRDVGGFYDFANIDTDAYRAERLAALVALLRHRNLMPRRPSRDVGCGGG